MGGRLQREISIEKKIEEKLKDKPQYLSEFYYWLNSKSALTKQRYIEYILNFVDFCNKEGVTKLEDFNLVTPSMMDKYVRNISLKTENGEVIGRNEPSIVNARICSVSTFFRFLRGRGIVTQNPCDLVERPKVPEKEEVVYLDYDEIQEMMAAIDADHKKWRLRNKTIVSLLLTTGIRIGALMDINVEDINFDTHVLYVTEKEGKQRALQLPDTVMELIDEWLDERDILVREHGIDSNALFVVLYGGKCKRIGQYGINSIIKKYTKGIKKNISAHKLRATFATSTYEMSGDIYLVSELLGHNSPSTTRRYARASEKKKGEAMLQMSKYIGL